MVFFKLMHNLVSKAMNVFRPGTDAGYDTLVGWLLKNPVRLKTISVEMGFY